MFSRFGGSVETMQSFQDTVFRSEGLGDGTLAPAINLGMRGFCMSSFSAFEGAAVSGLPSRERATEARDRERAQLLVVQEQRRLGRRMLALSAQLRLSGRPRRGVVSSEGGQ